MIPAACADLQAAYKHIEYTLLSAPLSLNALLHAPCSTYIEVGLRI